MAELKYEITVSAPDAYAPVDIQASLVGLQIVGPDFYNIGVNAVITSAEPVKS